MTDRLREAAQAALDALEWVYGGAPVRRNGAAAIRDLRAALAEQKHAPDCALLQIPSKDCDCAALAEQNCASDAEPVPLYTAPPRREWVSLTDEEQARLYKDWMDNETTDSYDLMHSVEAALKEKNHE